mmetsp:Transcript_8029/g.33549  ORF Transcript_8029/g.33549 Transcript_8029/m.33549 type:complete len:218 (-) Transcript_8029:356-1009(-)
MQRREVRGETGESVARRLVLVAAQRERELHGERGARVAAEPEPLERRGKQLVLALVQRRKVGRQRLDGAVFRRRGAPLASGRADSGVGGVGVARADHRAFALRDAHDVFQHAHQRAFLREAQGFIAEHLGARRGDRCEFAVAFANVCGVQRLELDVLVRARAHEKVHERVRAERQARTRAVQAELPSYRAARRRRGAVGRRAEARARVHGDAQRGKT